MKIRLYLDEDSMSDTLVRALEARGVDVVTVASPPKAHGDQICG